MFGIDADVAVKAVGLMLGFLHASGRRPVGKMIEAIPRRRRPHVASTRRRPGKAYRRTLTHRGGGSWARPALMSLGLGMGEITSLRADTIAAAANTRLRVVDEVCLRPVLSQFVDRGGNSRKNETAGAIGGFLLVGGLRRKPKPASHAGSTGIQRDKSLISRDSFAARTRRAGLGSGRSDGGGGGAPIPVKSAYMCA